MKNQLITAVLSFGLLASASAQTNDPSNVKYSNPYNLDIVAPAMAGGSDAQSANFQTNVLPGLLKLVQTNLAEKVVVGNLATVALDSSNLTLSQDANLRVYFLGEGAGYSNALGFSTTGTSTTTGTPLAPDAQLIFPNASSPGGYSGSKSTVRSSSEPLLPGDFVDLGKYAAGTALDFFLIANGALNGRSFFSTELANNSDKIVHAISLASNGSAYLVIGFEDLMGGGDKDYNDVVFAVEIGKVNVAKLTGIGAPEPSLAAGSLLALAALLGFRRRS